MRVHLLLILFLVSTASSRARNRKDIDEITTDANHEKVITKRDVSTQTLSNTISKLWSTFVALISLFFGNIVKTPKNLIDLIKELIIKYIDPLFTPLLSIVGKVL